MRYLILTYIKKPNGKIDEQMQVSQRLRNRDIQTANVILDFRDLQVEKASMNGVSIPRDFNKIVEYYMQHYESTITRLFNENGWEVELKKNEDPTNNSESQEHNPS